VQETARMMATLELAKKGVESAKSEICAYVWERYGFKVSNLFSYDVAEDREDIRQIFWLAVVEHIPKLDHRGNPIWHLAVRGFWQVGAHVRRKRVMVGLLSLDAPIQNGQETTHTSRLEMLPDYTKDVEGIVIRQIGSKQQVELMSRLEMPPTARRAFDAILSGEAGDPSEIGFNKSLAAALEVSPQRASQAMQALRGSVEAEVTA
jgi:hypothetical protein